MVTLSEDKIHRIAFAKYLLSQAKVHKSKGAPVCSFSILILHDLVEIFLQVAKEIHVPQIEKPRGDVLETLAKALNRKMLPDGHAINLEFINRLNQRRNALKHSTIFVNRMDVQNLYSETETFFIDFSKILFDLQFDKISLVLLIMNEKIRDNLKEAELKLEIKDFDAAIVSIAKSYHYLEHTEMQISGTLGYPVFKPDYGRELYVRSRTVGSPEADSNLRWLGTEVGKDFRGLNERLADVERIVNLGVDFKSYRKFKDLLPHIYLPSTKDTTDELHFSEPSKQLSRNIEAQDVTFCFEFVLDAALRIQSV